MTNVGCSLYLRAEHVKFARKGNVDCELSLNTVLRGIEIDWWMIQLLMQLTDMYSVCYGKNAQTQNEGFRELCNFTWCLFIVLGIRPRLRCWSYWWWTGMPGMWGYEGADWWVVKGRWRHGSMGKLGCCQFVRAIPICTCVRRKIISCVNWKPKEIMFVIHIY